MPTAKPPIQSSPSGSMKSARHMLARPSRFFTCWRRKGRRVSSLPARTRTSSPSRRQRHRPTVPRARQPMLGDDPVEHRLRRRRTGARAFADHRVLEDRGIIAGQLPGAEEGRPVDRVAQVARAAIRRSCAGRAARGGGALPSGSKAKALARASSSVASSFWPLSARVSRIVVIILRGLRDERLALRVGDQRRGDADRAAGVEDVDHRAFIGRVDAQRGVDLAGRRAADQQRQRRASRAASRSATVTISSSEGVIRPERPIMSALFSLAALRMSCQGTITPRSITS